MRAPGAWAGGTAGVGAMGGVANDGSRWTDSADSGRLGWFSLWPLDFLVVFLDFRMGGAGSMSAPSEPAQIDLSGRLGVACSVWFSRSHLNFFHFRKALVPALIPSSNSPSVFFSFWASKPSRLFSLSRYHHWSASAHHSWSYCIVYSTRRCVGSPWLALSTRKVRGVDHEKGRF